MSRGNEGDIMIREEIVLRELPKATEALKKIYAPTNQARVEMIKFGIVFNSLKSKLKAQE